jgi:hypothetical protein
MSAPKSLSKAGFVYVLSNESMPGIVKIGMTTRNPEIRLSEINSATGVLPFALEAVITSRNAKWTEREVHERLSARRISKNREFFRIDIEEARRTVFDVARQQGQRIHLGRRNLAPAAALLMVAGTVPAVATIHPYLVPVWLVLCLAAALTGRPRMIREFLGMVRHMYTAAVVGILMTAGALLITQATGHHSLSEAATILSEVQRILAG